jgi:ubiquinone/menaquinone biosynthesis C-methylase UbiE
LTAGLPTWPVYERVLTAVCHGRFDFVSLRERLFAAVYDPLSARTEKKFGAKLKHELLADVRGRVLEIGVGTGLSFAHYPTVEELVGVEPSEPMLRRARRRAHELGREVRLVETPAEALPFEDHSFDTVVSLAVLCTVDDPQRTLSEIRRVLRPDGRFVFLEHVRSTDPALARWQDRLERPWGWIAGGCHPNRRTLEAIERAGFEVVEVEEEELPDLPRLVKPNIKGFASPR